MKNEKYFIIEDNAEFEVPLCHLPGLEEINPDYFVNYFGEVRYIGPDRDVKKHTTSCCYLFEQGRGEFKFYTQGQIYRIVSKYFPSREVGDIAEILDIEPAKVIDMLQNENVGYVYELHDGDIVFNQKVTDKILVELIERRRACEEGRE